LKPSHWIIIVAIVASAAVGGAYLLAQSNERIAQGVAATATAKMSSDAKISAAKSRQESIDATNKLLHR